MGDEQEQETEYTVPDSSIDTEEDSNEEALIGTVLSDKEKELGVEIRTFEFGAEKIDYKLLNVTKVEQWFEANDFSMEYSMPTPGNQKVLIWPLFGMSYGMFCELETAFEEPILEERTELSAKEQTALKHAHIKERGEWQLKRQVRMLEVATRQVIPGDDMSTKMKWVAERNNGELQALCAYIADVCTGLREGQMHEIMKQIHAMSSHETKIVSNFSEWEIAAQTLANFRMCRPVEDFVFQIPMKGISQTRKLEIDQECILPVPPMKMGIDPQTQRPSPKYKKENPRDPDYIRAKRAVEDKWMIMILDECMPFKIPGVSIKEKREWLNRRLLGDIIKLRQFIDNELLGSLSRYNFFTKGSALLS